MALTAEEKEQATLVLKSLSQEDREKFKSKFSKLESKEKKEEVTRRLLRSVTPDEEVESSSRVASALDRAEPLIGRTLQAFFQPGQQGFRTGQELTGQKVAGAEALDRSIGRETRGALEGATGGFLRGGIEAATGQDIGRGGGFGQFVGTIVGPGGLATKAAGKLIRGSGIFAAGSRGGVAGVGAGFLAPISEDPFDFEARTVGALIGGAFGFPLGSSAALIGKFKKASTAGKDIKNLLDRQRDARRVRTERNIRFDDRARKAKTVGDLIKVPKTTTDPAIKEAIKKQLQNVDELATQEADELVLANRPKMAQAIRKAKDIWGEKFDDALNESDIQALDFNEFVEDVFQKTLDEIEIRDIKIAGSTINKIRSLIRNFEPKTVTSPILRPTSGLEGVPITQTTAAKEIPLKKLVDLRRQISKQLSSGFKKGQFDEEDLTGLIFNRRLGAKLEESVEGLKDLNTSYRGIISQGNFVFKNFKPQAIGSTDTKTGIRVLKRMGGLGKKLTPDDLRQLRVIEEGDEFIPGIGNITGNLPSRASRIKELQAKISPKQAAKIDATLQKQIDQVKRIKNKIASRRQVLNNQDKIKLIELDEELAFLREVAAGNKIGAAFGRFAAFNALDFGVKFVLFKMLTGR